MIASRRSHVRWTHLAVALAMVLAFLLGGPAPGTTLARSASRTPNSPHLAVGQALTSHRKAQIQRSLGHLPLTFEANHGQAGKRVSFISRGSGYTLFLSPNDAVLALSSTRPSAVKMPGARTSRQVRRDTTLHLHFVGANAHAATVGVHKLSATVNYFIGKNRRTWLTGIPTYARVEYRNVYPGINLVYYGRQGHLEYDWVVRPGADTSKIVLRITGAKSLALDRRHDLAIRTAVGTLLEQHPRIYQHVGDMTRLVAGHFTLTGSGRVGLTIGRYDHSKSLVIDPQLVYAAHFGITPSENANSIAVDAQGNAYIAGRAYSPSTTLGGPGAQLTGAGGDEVLVFELNAAGTGLIYTTFIGGSLSDVGNAVAVDSAGYTYVTGYTNSGNFPITAANASQGSFGGVTDAFLSVLAPGGTSLFMSTYLGGTGDDGAYGLAVSGTASSGGSVFLGGQGGSGISSSVACRGGTGFVANIAIGGSSNPWTPKYTFCFGAQRVLAVALDSAGNPWVTGYTGPGLAICPSSDAACSGGTTAAQFQNGTATAETAFVAEVSGSTPKLIASTYLGGTTSTTSEAGAGIAVDGTGVYVTGWTTSPTFPTTTNAFQTTIGGATTPSQDAFVTKLNLPLTGLVYSTFLGGSASEAGAGISVDGAGQASVTGFTQSTDFPHTTGTPGYSGVSDAFVTELDSSGKGAVYSMYLGGSGDDAGYGVAVHNGNTYVAGNSISTDFPVCPGPNGLCAATSGTPYSSTNADLFVSQISPAIPAGSKLVTNGSFEAPTYTPSNWAWVSSIPGWSPCGASKVIEIGNAWLGTAQDGAQYTELNSDGPGAICQTISTVPGEAYQLSFYFSARPGTPSSSNQMDVTWGGTNLTPTVISADGSNLSNTSWSRYTFTVTASSTSTILDFADTGAASFNGCACGSLVDNVQVQALPTPAFAPNQDGRSTWAGTTANPLDITGTAGPNATVTLYSGGTCTGTAVASGTADGSGAWSIPITTISAEGAYTYSATATYSLAAAPAVSPCSTPITATIDRTMPSSSITFPAVASGAAYVNASAWTGGCGAAGANSICGTASDSGGSGVAAVYVAIEAADGTFWNGTGFTSSGAWLKANGTTSWSLPVPRPADGVYTVASTAIDNAGNTQRIFAMSVAGMCDPSGIGGSLSLNGGSLAINGGLCIVRGSNGGVPVSGALSLNGGSLALNGGSLALNGGSLALNGGSLAINGGSCTVTDSSGKSGNITISTATTPATLVSTGGTLSLNGGSLALNGGSLALNGGSLALNGGSLALTGGSLPLNGGQCTFSASGSSGTLSLNGGSLALNGGSLAINGGSLALNGGSLAINGGSLPLNGGALSLNGGSLAINGGAGANAGNVVVDTTPPSVSHFEVDGQQGDGAANIDPSATFHIQFSESMQPATVSGSTVTVTPGAGTPACDTGDATCTNASFTGLSPSTSYTVSVSGATDLAGNSITPATFHFTTAAASPLSGADAGDTDGDNIPNGWDGTITPTFTLNGQSTNTAAWGFSPNHQDLCLVENYMAGKAADGNSYDQHITQAANQAIVNAFANAPTTNPDGSHGIHLVIFEGSSYSAGLPPSYNGPYFGGEISMTDPLGDASTGAFDWSATWGGSGQSFDSIRTANFVPTGLSQFCHYAVIAHTLGGTGSSGASRGIKSSDLVIALGGTRIGLGVGTQTEQQGTVMHELGHNLGLHHGGAVAPGDPPPSDLDLNYKPNYLSVMNYFFQFTGIPGGSAPYGLDYSHGTMPSLNENALNDSLGLGSAALGFGTRYLCGSSATPNIVSDASTPINWGCNASGPLPSTSPDMTDINGDGVLETLNDYNDWAHLAFNGGDIGMGAVGAPFEKTTTDISSGAGGGGPDAVTTIEAKSATFGWSGFFPPLNPDSSGTVLNTGKAGRTYPVKFQLKDSLGNYVSTLGAVRSVTYSQNACSGSTTNVIDTSTTSSAGLHYDSTANQYVYNWATPSAAGCYMLRVNLMDGTTRMALFELS